MFSSSLLLHSFNAAHSFEAPLTPTMKKYLNIAHSRPPSSQSTHAIPAPRPTSSLAYAPPKRAEPHPRPATSLAHHRTASSSTLAPTAPSSKLTRSRTEGTIAVPDPSSKRKEDMPPPAIIPQHRPQGGAELTAPPERPLPPAVRQETKGPDRPERLTEAPSSRSTTTQVQRPDPAQRPVHAPKPHTGPLRAEPTSIRERLLGRGQRAPLPEPKPEPPSRPTQEKQAMPVVPKRLVLHTCLAVCSLFMACRSRLDSVRHGPKASAAITAAKRAVTQVAGASSAVSESSGTSRPASAQSIVEKKERPAEGKKADSKPPPTAASKTGSIRAQGKKEIPRAGPSVSDRPKPSTSTRSTGKVAPEPRAQKAQPKANPTAVAAGEKKEKPSQSSKSVPMLPPKKVVARTGGVTQPTLSQLARIKASEEEKGRRADAKGTTKPLTIRRKCKVVHPKVSSNETEMATTTPLPPSPEVRPVDVPLPESPVSAPLEVQEEQVVVPSEDDAEGAAVPVEAHPPMPTPVQVHPFGVAATAKTPISALVHSIQRGFLFSPNSPLSPAQPDAEWEYPAWPGPPGVVLGVGEEPSFEGVEESTIKRPLMAVGTDIERRALTEMN